MKYEKTMYVLGTLTLIAAALSGGPSASVLAVCGTLIIGLVFSASAFEIKTIQAKKLDAIAATVTKLENDVNNLRMARKLEQGQ